MQVYVENNLIASNTNPRGTSSRGKVLSSGLQINYQAIASSIYALCTYDSARIYTLIINIVGDKINEGQTVINNPPQNMSSEIKVRLYLQNSLVNWSSQITSMDDFAYHNRLTTIYTLTIILQEAKPNRLILPESILDDKERNYCACVIEEGLKQPGACNLEKAWKEDRDGTPCNNPYAICAEKFGTSVDHCELSYNLENFSDDQLIVLAHLKNIMVTTPFQREQILSQIRHSH